MSSQMEDVEAPADVTVRIGARVSSLRAERGYSLDVLAARSGVSRSAISLIERCATNATAVVLERLATALGVPLAALFDAPPAQEDAGPVARRADQPRWRDPQSGYLRRNVSPPGWPSPIRIVEVDFPAGATVSYETAARDVPVHQQVWLRSGELEVTLGAERHQLDAGDCLAMELDQPVTFHNPGDRVARYVVVVVSDPATLRRASS